PGARRSRRTSRRRPAGPRACAGAPGWCRSDSGRRRRGRYGFPSCSVLLFARPREASCAAGGVADRAGLHFVKLEKTLDRPLSLSRGEKMKFGQLNEIGTAAGATFRGGRKFTRGRKVRLLIIPARDRPAT